MKWLITGGCGFIGTSLIRLLKKEGGHAIRVLDNLSVGTRDDLGQAVEFFEIEAAKAKPIQSASRDSSCELVVGDILDEALALKVCAGADVIVHLAANTGVPPSVRDPRSDCMNNVIGTLNCLEGARHNGVKRFIFASSGAPAGEVEPPIHEELPPHPVSPYGASKLAGEGYCSAYFRTFGVATVALRFGNVYGPGSNHKSSVVAKFIRRALMGKPLEIYGDGSQTRDFIYIGDLTGAILKAATAEGVGGEIFQIATSRETTVNEMTEVLVAALKDRGILNFQVLNAASRLGDVKRNFSDTSKARTRLGWESRVKIENGIDMTIDWFLTSRNKSRRSD